MAIHSGIRPDKSPMEAHADTIGQAVADLNEAMRAAGADGLKVEIRHEEPFDAATPTLSGLISVPVKAK